jgi:biotin-(acetyl-CoA carboxylase) ligase
MIKWTNDILYEGKKLIGILCRHQPSRNLYTIGIGFNTNNDIDPNLGKFGAVSLRSILGFETSNDYLCKTLINAMEDNCLRNCTETQYLSYCNNFLFGKNRWASIEISGIEIKAEIIGVDPTGALMVRKEMGEYISVHTGSIIELLV